MSRCPRLFAVAGIAFLLTGVGAALHGASLDEGLRALRAGDYASARAELEPLAEAGHPEALAWLAWLYEHGRGVPRDPQKALTLFREAAARGSTLAMRSLAYRYARGQGVHEDWATAFTWWLKAAEAGDPEAQYAVGVSLFHGRGTERDVDAAVAWWRKAAEAGVDEARLDLARILADPEQEPYDIEQAVELYELLAIKGHLDAQLALVWLYKDGELLPRDLSKARVWARRVAEQDPTLGEMLLAGIDLDQAAENLRLMTAATLRLIEDRTEELKRRHVYEGMLDHLCALDAVEVDNAKEAAVKREVLEEVSSFLERLRAQGETPCR